MHAQIALSQIRNFNDFYIFAKKAEPTLSFWGQRGIMVHGFEGILPLDSFTKSVLEMVVEKPFRPELNGGGLLSRLIDQIYEKSDQQVKTANCFTRFLTFIRYFVCCNPFHPFSPLSWLWSQAEEDCYISLKRGMLKAELSEGDLSVYKRFLKYEPA